MGKVNRLRCADKYSLHIIEIKHMARKIYLNDILNEKPSCRLGMVVHASSLVHGRLIQEDCKFQAIWGYIVRPCIKK